MDTNVYALERQAEWKLAAARADGARCALLASLRPERPGVLAAIGLTLIRVGRRLHRRRGRRRRATPVALTSPP